MNGSVPRQRVELDQRISTQETRTAEDLATIRLLEGQWEEYRQVMRESTDRFERAGVEMGATNYFVQRGLAARGELDSFVGQLAYEQAELLEEAAREVRSKSEVELDRLRQAKAEASWA